MEDTAKKFHFKLQLLGQNIEESTIGLWHSDKAVLSKEDVERIREYLSDAIELLDDNMEYTV